MVSARTAPKAVGARFATLLRDIHEFGGEVGDVLRAQPGPAAGFLRTSVAHAALLFQKWNLEILYLLALQMTLRFGELQRQLEGISSRTLSLKLEGLENAGYVVRT